MGAQSELDPIESGPRTRNGIVVALWALTAAFGTYFCMYMFRKPFTAAAFEVETGWGIGLKFLLVASQVAGYTVSKFIGIKVVSELPPKYRALGIIGLIGMAELALVLFGIVPAPWNAVCLFLNGLPLGMVFGLVLGFLEGRRLTEALAAGLCASFILADGVSKSVGKWLLGQGVDQFWMPAAAGGLFLPFLGLFTWMLTGVARPDHGDIAARSERSEMTARERWALFSKHAIGLVCIIVLYLLVTVLRSLRADFQPEIWKGLGVEAEPSVFTTTELWVSVIVLLVNGSLVMMRNNRLAFYTSLGICAVGLGWMVAVVACRQGGWVDPFSYMVMIGLGLYLPYVAIHTTVFERLLATTRDKGTSSYLLYLADSFGYLGYVAVLLAKGLLAKQGDLLSLFENAAMLAGAGGLLLLATGTLAFARSTKPRQEGT
jgi:hypothetical protein